MSSRKIDHFILELKDKEAIIMSKVKLKRNILNSIGFLLELHYTNRLRGKKYLFHQEYGMPHQLFKSSFEVQ